MPQRFAESDAPNPLLNAANYGFDVPRLHSIVSKVTCDGGEVDFGSEMVFCDQGVTSVAAHLTRS